MTPIDASSKSPKFGRYPASIVMSLPVKDQFSRVWSGYSCDGDGYRECAETWETVRGIPAQYWQALPRSYEDQELFPALSAEAALGSRPPYATIAREVRHALEHGIRSSTALACMLLAAIALERHGGGDDALALAQAALDMAAQPGQGDGHCVRVIHATLITARTAGLGQASSILVHLTESPALLVVAQMDALGTAFAAGMRLTELSHRLDGILHNGESRQPKNGADPELSIRARLIRVLLSPQPGPKPESLGWQGDVCAKPSAGYWITRLQACWYAGDRESALYASRRAAELVGPLTSVANVLFYHLFSALALGRPDAPDDAAELDMHCLALHRLACACPASGASIAELASAVRERRAGRLLAALRTLERVCDTAARHGQHWVAALAWEEAAMAASDAELASSAAHYQQQALASLRHWGALGRVDTLKRQWGENKAATAGEQCDENERLRRTGKAGEMGLSIAHEVNQPLAAIALHSSAALKWLRRAQPDVARALASLELISEAGRHAGDIIRGIQRLASHNESEIGCVSVDQAINVTLRSLQRPLRKHGIAMEMVLSLGDVVIQADRVQFRQVVTNLLVNAIEALSGTSLADGGRRVRVESRLFGDDEIEIVVEDNGPGIEPVNRERVFSSLFTTKPRNTGLGLSICLAIIRAHQGRIDFEPREPHGARFRVRLPVRGP